MGKVKDLKGKRFNFMQVLRFDRNEPGGAMWWCRCVLCGTEKSVRGGRLVDGSTKSCGCWKASIARSKR